MEAEQEAGSEGRGREPRKEDMTDEKEEEEDTDVWRTVELQRLALRSRLVHHLAGVSSCSRTPSR